MIVAGIILLVIAYLVDLPGPLDTLALVAGWILFIVGLVLLVLHFTNRDRRLYY
jgi:uncharacterized membrane protein HdeD (DUF308 family)